FFFQAEDGIRDFHVTGVQTCALPIYPAVDVEAVPGPQDLGLVELGVQLDLAFQDIDEFFPFVAAPAFVGPDRPGLDAGIEGHHRSEEHSLNSSHVKISYAVFCLKKKK